MESERKVCVWCVCVLGNLKQAIDYKEQRKAKEIITRKNRKTRVRTYLSVLMFVGLSVFLSNEVQPGQKGY